MNGNYIKKINLILIIILLIFLVHMDVDAQSWTLIELTGDWDKVDITSLSSKMDNEGGKVTFKATHVKLGSYKTTLILDLSGKGAIVGKIIFEIVELNFKIEYTEKYMPGTMGFGDKITNELIIKYKGEWVVNEKQSATWPYDNRLNTRLYLWIWRSTENTLTWIISDGYLQKDSVSNIYYTGNITYYGEELTFTLSIEKMVERGEGKLEAFLIYNEIDSTGNIFHEYKLETIDYGFNTFFYMSLSLFIVVITGHILSKVLRREMEIKEYIKVAEKRKR